MSITLKRVYEKPTNRDGYRVLVERLWPRGVSKEQAHIDLWLKDAAPSTALRKWFGHDPEKWPEFKQRYFAELDQEPSMLADIEARAKAAHVTFVYASKEEHYNNAVALKEYLEHDG
ncbi:MAG: hypothetical protein NPIRA02_38890 [Nitrospirales bacterium]|nr:MAG: hypothetical protein NPIRA02_38890 [Nitrospirales bacterium]